MSAAGKASAGLDTGAAAASATAAIGTAAAAANAVPVAGTAVSVALGLAAGLTRLFAGKGPRGKRRQKQAAQAKRQLEQRQKLMMQAYQPPQQPFQQAPPTQGMGTFQQMQMNQGPLYSSEPGKPQPGY